MSEKKKEVSETKKNNWGVIVLSILLAVVVLCFTGYVLIDKGVILKKDTAKEQENIKKLDVNSVVVQKLYNSVSTNMNGWGKYWMYNDSEDKIDSEGDFYTKTAKEEIKMKLVSLNLTENHKLYAGCEGIKIPSKVDSLYDSVCYRNSQQNILEGQSFYTKQYIETVYKSLFGSDSKLDTSVIISTAVFGGTVYKYIESEDAYYEYRYDGGGGFLDGGYSSELEKAEKDGNKLIIYEKVNKENSQDKVENVAETETFYFIYTFELDDNELYKFVSRVKEDI